MRAATGTAHQKELHDVRSLAEFQQECTSQAASALGAELEIRDTGFAGCALRSDKLIFAEALKRPELQPVQ